MYRVTVFVVILYLHVSVSSTEIKQRKFSETFSFGVATSAYQVEGGWNADGKGPSIWDEFVHRNPSPILNGDTGDVACNSYNNYTKDVKMLRELAVDHYRFSISWSRILPNGFRNNINEAGVRYYDKLINELLKYNIEPIVTMYHFDLPARLQELGGWANPLSVKWFKEYADVLFQLFSQKVNYWISVNQPNSICLEGYGEGSYAPGVHGRGIGEYNCIKNVLLAHAEAYKLFKTKYKRPDSMLGIALAANWIEPANATNEESKRVAQEQKEFTLALYMDPIFSKHGDFPNTVKEIVSKKSKEQGFQNSRLPALNKAEIELIKNSADFLGINYYTTCLVSRDNVTNHEIPSYEDDVRRKISYNESWKQSMNSPWRSNPRGIYKMLTYLNKKYGSPRMLITETGWSTTWLLNDSDRIEYIREHLKEVQLAIEDGVNLGGYTLWSLLDNFEWLSGFNERFGLYNVNHKNIIQPRMSAFVYREIIESRTINDSWIPKNYEITISNRRLTKPRGLFTSHSSMKVISSYLLASSFVSITLLYFVLS